MCDTHVLIKNDVVYFAKNSDREPDEAQLVVGIPAGLSQKPEKLNTTYLSIDQSPARHGVILSKLFWIWGAEMGANDRGVVIGNEAVYTRLIEKTRGLIGMDLLRLGLERGDSAEHAMHIIIELMEKYGQGGECGFRDKRMRYDNSFILVDPSCAWALETAGRFWAAKQVTTFGAISNCLTIGEDYDLKSPGLEDKARKGGFFRGKGDFSFKKAFDTRLIPFLAASRRRLKSSRHCLQQTIIEPEMSVQQMMANLRTHFDPEATPAAGSNRDICMHAGGFIRRSQTCGSMVSRLSAFGNTHFFTGASAPCLSLFKPVAFHPELSFSVLNKDEKTLDGSLWQRGEHIHRGIIFKEEDRHELQGSIAQTENQMLGIMGKNGFQPSPDDLMAADGLVKDWMNYWYEKYKNEKIHYPVFSLHSQFWKYINEREGFS